MMHFNLHVQMELPLERGVNFAANDDEALRRASAWGQTEIVRMLLDLPLERGVNHCSRLSAASSVFQQKN